MEGMSGKAGPAIERVLSESLDFDMTPLRPVLEQVLREYMLEAYGIHGVLHWGRVLENGLRLAKVTGANEQVVALFALLHDSRRRNDGYDPAHGRRGAELARELRGSLFELADAEFHRLFEACAHHTRGLTDADVTIQTCWDADRLDLGRVGTTPSPKRLCTKAARNPLWIRWAHGRATEDHVPELVRATWERILRGPKPRSSSPG
jgi:uncharacterized protein